MRSFPAQAWFTRGIVTPGAILLVGSALRVIYFLRIKDAFLVQTPFLDAGFYHRWALEITAGDWAGIKRGVFTMSPGYSYFLAMIYSFFGAGIKTAIFIQMLLGVACAWMIFVLGRRLISREAGLCAAAIFLLYAPELLYEGLLLKAGLINAVNTGALLAASLAHPAAWLLSGFLTGYSSHLRPTALFLVPVFVFWLWRRSGRKVLAPLLFTGGLFLALGPVALRNYTVGGEWIWTTAHGGMNFYTGNSPESRGPYEDLPFARSDPAFEQDDFLREAQRRSGRLLTAAESSRYWYAEAWRFIRREPVREAALLLKKAIIFCNDYETPINMDLDLLRGELGPTPALPLVSFAVLLSLGLPGMLRAPRNPLLLGYLAVVLLSNVIFFVSSEYRFPVVPVLCIYAGFGIHRAVLDARLRSLKKLAMSGMIFLAVLGFASADIYGTLLRMPEYKRRNAANSLYSLGLEYQKAGRSDEASGAYLASLKLRPAHALTHNNLGTVLADQGRLTEAADHFQKALPGFPGAYENLGRVFTMLGRHKEAADCYKDAERFKAPRYRPSASGRRPGD